MPDIGNTESVVFLGIYTKYPGSNWKYRLLTEAIEFETQEE